MIFTAFIFLGVIYSAQSKSNVTESTAASVGHPLQFHKSNAGNHYAEFIRFDVDTPVSVKPSWDYLKVDPLINTQPTPFGYQKRAPRSDEYDSYERGYQEFLRNYHNDGEHDNYKVKEDEEEEDIGRSDDEDNDDDDDDSSDENNSDGDESEDSESEEKYHKPKKSSKSKGKKSKDDGSDEDYDRVKQESNKKKKSKHCKTEKRGNMVCNVCHNPKNDESSEQCSYSSDPPDKKYAYSKGKKFNSKDNDNSREDQEQHRELTTRRPQFYHYRHNHPVSPPHYRKYPQPAIRYGTPRYQIYRPIPAMILRPTTHYYPRKQQPSRYPRRYTQVGQESRLHKDVIGYEYGRPRNSAMKRVKNNNQRVKSKRTPKNEHVFGRASDENVDQKFADFITKDWSNCERSFENGLICYECDDKKGSHKECMFVSANKPNGSHSGYSKIYKYASGTHDNNDRSNDSSNESNSSDDKSVSLRRKGKSTVIKKRKIPKNNLKGPGPKEEPEIIYGQPYEFVRPYTPNSDDSNSEEKHVLKRMAEAGEKTDNKNRTII